MNLNNKAAEKRSSLWREMNPEIREAFSSNLWSFFILNFSSRGSLVITESLGESEYDRKALWEALL
jgi:hypothetical protein